MTKININYDWLELQEVKELVKDVKKNDINSQKKAVQGLFDYFCAKSKFKETDEQGKVTISPFIVESYKKRANEIVRKYLLTI